MKAMKMRSCGIYTDIHRRSQNLGHLYSGMGLKLGVFGVLSHNQTNFGSGAYVIASTGV